ncbi:DUF4926 domain-containing protein [Undibacterium umbellatum]|uniref:DUF4926 domain-containing protein n=1 Tax=Undibacterium umbellatum TaxID=2762300 RepID=A0ABR6Z8P5_9BURK|nr:DUF4926 domain-containing protein [Undibacterium umbellatum]MBC3908143.1 DUF4926 domain-containing protein [Undibacterium umbellatum]
MSFALFEVVFLNENLSDEGLLVGTKGTVIDIYIQPSEAYEVEFCDSAGRTIATLALLPNQLRLNE